MDYPYDEILASQYPDNVVEKFATAFSRRSAYDGPGYCTVSYSQKLTHVHCISDIEIYQPIVGVMFLVMLLSMLRSCCCRN